MTVLSNMHVYAITNDANGKYYIGKTISKDLQAYFNVVIRRALRGFDDNLSPEVRVEQSRKAAQMRWRNHVPRAE